MSPMTYGISGLRLRDYIVYLMFESSANYGSVLGLIDDSLTANDAANYELARTKLNSAIAIMLELGECRKESIDSEISDGDSVAGNRVGKVVYEKNGVFSAELINATVDNIAALELEDGNEAIVLLVEVDATRIFDYAGAELETNECIFLMDTNKVQAGSTSGVGATFNHSEKIVGGTIPITTFSMEKEVRKASSFRQFVNIPAEQMHTQLVYVGGSTVEGDTLLTVAWTASVDALCKGYLLNCYLVSSGALVESKEVTFGTNTVTFNGLTNDVAYRINARSADSSFVPKSESTTLELTPTAT